MDTRNDPNNRIVENASSILDTRVARTDLCMVHRQYLCEPPPPTDAERRLRVWKTGGEDMQHMR